MLRSFPNQVENAPIRPGPYRVKSAGRPDPSPDYLHPVGVNNLVAHDRALVSTTGHALDGALVSTTGHALNGALVAAAGHALDGALVASAGHGLHDGTLVSSSWHFD